MDSRGLRSHARRKSRSPAIAAFLSFIWPGLGQWYAGRPRAAVLFAAPIAAILLLLLVWLAGGLERALVDLLLPAVAVTFIVLVLAEGAWRIAALIHAAWLTGGQRAFREPPVGGAVAALTLLVVVSHIWAASVAWSLFEASDRVFDPRARGRSPQAPRRRATGSSLRPRPPPKPRTRGSTSCSPGSTRPSVVNMP